MGDSGRDRPDRRRVGDATRARIEGLADGWSVDKTPPEPSDTERVERPEPEEPPPAPRRSSKPSGPPPIPPPKSPPPTPEPALEISATGPRADDSTSADDRTVLQLEAPGHHITTAGLRTRDPEAVPRTRGVLGDIKYVFDAVFGVTSARRELAEVQATLEGERHARDQRLIAAARYTIGDNTTDLPAVKTAREQLAAIEERRSRHAGGSAAAEEEIASIERTREQQAAAWHEEDKRLAGELVAIQARLAPVEKQATAARKRVADMKTTAAGLDKKVTAEERKLVAVKTPKDGPAAIEAHLASLRAEREAVLADEPVLAAELDELEPQIASLRASLSDAENERKTAQEKEERDAARAIERIAAARQRRQVEEDAVGDLGNERDAALLALGEILDVERPAGIASRLAGADEHAVAIATHERRTLELRELVDGIHKPALVRGIGWLALILAGVVGLVWFVVSRV